VKTFERLSLEPLTPALHETIHGFAQTIAQQPVQVLPRVHETLEYLSSRRHQLILVTKGDLKEQSGKVERSGLKDYFSAVEIVAEKHVPEFRAIMGRYRLAAEHTWMVGNSPRSDINPALGAGINAVFVPHDDTWVLEHEELARPELPSRLMIVNTFADLVRHF